MQELTILAVLALAAWFWFDHRRAQDYAVDYCRRACADGGFQFLDETAAVSRLRLQRDGGGTLRLERWFTFEYSTAPGNRGHGYLVMLGLRPTTFVLEGRLSNS